MIIIKNIIFSDVTFGYNEKNILENFNLSINSGEFVAILGHNGSGKSTIAQLINGLLLPKAGKICIDDLSTLNENDLWNIRQKVGIVFQNPDNQLVTSIVEEDIAFGLENLGVDEKIMHERIYEVLSKLNMIDYIKSDISKLSGGQKQKIAIAGVLAMMPECIIFDEPTSMLDPKGRDEVIKTILDLRKNGYTIILITHFMSEAMLADRVIIMNNGKIVKDANPNIVFSDINTLLENSLDMPENIKIAYKLKQMGFDIEIKLRSREELVKEICRLKFKI